MSSEELKLSVLRREKLDVPKVMPPTEARPLHIIHALESYDTDYSMCDRYARRGLEQWSEYCQSLLNRADPKALLAMEW